MKSLADYQYNEKVITLGDIIGLFLAYDDDKIYVDIEDKNGDELYVDKRIVSIPECLFERRVLATNDYCESGACLLIRMDI